MLVRLRGYDAAAFSVVLAMAVDMVDHVVFFLLLDLPATLLSVEDTAKLRGPNVLLRCA